jgi:PPM family protein phosphatase
MPARARSGSRPAQWHTVGPIEVASATDRGRVRTSNEDHIIARRLRIGGEGFGFGVVADGMGGGVHGADASRIASETLQAALDHGRIDTPEEALVEAVAVANARVYKAGCDMGVPAGRFGTTLVAFLVEEATGVAWIANVGDSRAYLIDGPHVHRISRDHSLVAERVAAGILTEAESREMTDRNIITRSLGVAPRVGVDLFGPRELGADERLLLCSDGIHAELEDAVIARIAISTSTLRLPAALVAAAVGRGGHDNSSVGVLGRIGRQALTRSPKMHGVSLASGRIDNRAWPMQTHEVEGEAGIAVRRRDGEKTERGRR